MNYALGTQRVCIGTISAPALAREPRGQRIVEQAVKVVQRVVVDEARHPSVAVEYWCWFVELSMSAEVGGAQRHTGPRFYTPPVE